jgi:7-cyano-7-deazaguanine synthase
MGLDFHVLDLKDMSRLINSALHGYGEIPHGHYEAESQKATISPNRNMIFLAIAAGYAQTIGAEVVAYAAHSNDRAVYPDCRPEFINSAAETLHLGTGGEVRLSDPFADLTKAEIVNRGLGLDVPYELTWSCYEGAERPCLQCGTCLERIEAFNLVGCPDPALSEDEWSTALIHLKEAQDGHIAGGT